MLDSDSDFEYADDGGGSAGSSSSSSSENEYGGKLALGLDPQDTKEYDGRSTPQNGSQYLMKVMSEKKVVPKVVCADLSKIAFKNVKKDENEDVAMPSYLDRFLQKCNVNDQSDLNSRLLPSSKWREETMSNFSLMRSRIEQWRHKVESCDIQLDDSVELPETNDNAIWLKFCFGQPFVKLALASKSKSEEQKITDFFLDLYDSSISKLLEDQKAAGDGNGNINENPDQSSSSILSEMDTDADANDNAKATNEKSDQSAGSVTVLGHRPLMRIIMKLHQGQLENLIKCNLLWMTNMGFINECQGQWLYATLACLHKPIDPNIMSDIRAISRKLIKVRNSTSMWNAPTNSEPESGENSEKCLNARDDADFGDDERVPNFINTLNLFIYIISDYFDQKDLVMKL